jgi:hypothetical protein
MRPIVHGLSYRAPSELLNEARVEMRRVSQERLFNDPRHQRLQDLWCAAMFGLGYEKHVLPCQVALNATTRRTDADFFLKVGEHEAAFQTVEALEPNRRRGMEFQGIRGRLPCSSGLFP